MHDEDVDRARFAQSVWGWAIEPELLKDIAIELFHDESAGDEMRVTLMFKDGRESRIIAGLANGQWRRAFDAIREAIGASKP